MPRALAITLAALAAIFFACALRYAPPSPRSKDAAPSEFSAERARVVQTKIARYKRPVGSEGNAEAREYLRDELQKSGFETEIQHATSCSYHGACAFVSNVVATRPGSDPSETGSVLLMAHYDSVACSTGASDDGGGTSAVVETARALAAGPPTRRPIVIVLTDAEESGLLGALAFHQKHPLAKHVIGAINVDSRGGSGASAMFETSAGNAWLVGEVARHVARPVTSSLFYEIYRRMPNDTDFTAVKTTARGLNFANIARIEAYHTPLDDIAHADLATLQHHGDNALAMTRALASAGAELAAPLDPKDDAVWFDVLALFVVRWPVAWTIPIALLALALLASQTIRLRAFGRAMPAALGVLAAAVATSIAMGFALQGIGATPVPWVAYQEAALFSMHSATIATGLGIAIVFARHHDDAPLALWSGTWLLFALLGVATAVVAPGAAFLFVVPALTAGLTAFVPAQHRVVASIAPCLVAGVLFLPITLLANDALGLAIPALAAAPTTLLVATLTPMAILPKTPARPPLLRGTFLLGAASLVALLVAAGLPKFSRAVPQRVNVVVRDDHDAGDAPSRTRVFVEASWGGFPWGAPPAPMIAAFGAQLATANAAPTPFSMASPNAQVTSLDLPAPSAVATSATSADGRRTVHARVSSLRGARTIIVSHGVSRQVVITVDGERAIPRSGAVLLRAVPSDGAEIVVDAHGSDLIDLQILDVTHDLPKVPSAAAVTGARPASASETQEGDITVVSRRVRL